MSEALMSMLVPKTRGADPVEDALSLPNLPISEILLEESAFIKMLRLERKRTERSGRRFVLMLLESSSLLKPGNHADALEKVLNVLARTTRETDIKGWYESGSTLGVIFTEVDPTHGKAVAKALLTRITGALCTALSIEDINEIRISFHVYPEDPGHNGSGGESDPRLYPDLGVDGGRKKAGRVAKRSLDVAGSLFGLVVLSPLLVAIAVGIKLTSPGPVLFRQRRVGMYGRRFTFLKFRSMYVNNDDTVHREFTRAFIAGSQNGSSGQNSVYKLTGDSRVTALGRLLRKTSLDELPQLFNVLVGQMSLVGPRPAIPYEVEAYEPWHRHRVLAVRPGITGLWQIAGRSSVKFDDMIRLDLRYASAWSFWLDVKILLRTPRAVLMGSGAY